MSTKRLTYLEHLSVLSMSFTALRMFVGALNRSPLAMSLSQERLQISIETGFATTNVPESTESLLIQYSYMFAAQRAINSCDAAPIESSLVSRIPLFTAPKFYADATSVSSVESYNPVIATLSGGVPNS